MKYLGVDWGLKRVGLAISEGQLASPFQTIEIKGLDDGVEKIIRVIENEKIDLVVIGKPEGEMGKLVEKTINRLKQRGVNTIPSDETLSSKEAAKMMIEVGKGQKARRDDNATAAAIILQRFLDDQEEEVG